MDGNKTHSRIRQRHPWQITMPKSGLLALEEGEAVKMGPRSMEEFFVLEECVSYCAKECIDINADNIHIIV